MYDSKLFEFVLVDEESSFADPAKRLHLLKSVDLCLPISWRHVPVYSTRYTDIRTRLCKLVLASYLALPRCNPVTCRRAGNESFITVRNTRRRLCRRSSTSTCGEETGKATASRR